MRFYLFDTVSSDPFCDVSFEQSIYQRFGLDCHVTWEAESSVANVLVQNVYVLVEVRWLSDKHFVQDTPDSVDVCAEAGAFLVQHLGR